MIIIKTMNKSIFAIIFLAVMFIIPGIIHAQYYGNCTSHAYRLCVGNSTYWYGSCGPQQSQQFQQDLIQNCSMWGQTCQYGQCVINVQPVVPQYTNYAAHYRTACYANSIHWFDSLGAESGLYKNCADSNSCTADACSGGKCSNTMKCDGSTCAPGSADYNTYCLSNTPVNTEQTGAPANNNTNTGITPPAGTVVQCGNGYCESGETATNCPNDCETNTASGLSISFFAKQDVSSPQWQKTAEAVSNSNVYFMISVANNSTAQIDNVNVSASIPAEISSLGNLKLDNVQISGDIVSGINIGSIAPSITKSITFEGRTQTISETAAKQAIAISNVSGVTQSDSVSINLVVGPPAAAVSNAPAASGFGGFLGRWYLWILGGLVLIFLFVVVFKRLSSEV
jgi:hypothetical protein